MLALKKHQAFEFVELTRMKLMAMTQMFNKMPKNANSSKNNEIQVHITNISFSLCQFSRSMQKASNTAR